MGSLILNDLEGGCLKKKKYLYKRSLIVSEITAIASCDREIFPFTFDIVGTVPTERHLKKLAREKVKERSDKAEILSIAKIESKRKILGITAEGFLNEADELDPATGQPKYYLKEKD